MPRPVLGPKESDTNKREFTEEQLRAGQGMISKVAMGSAQTMEKIGTTKTGITFGNDQSGDGSRCVCYVGCGRTRKATFFSVQLCARCVLAGVFGYVCAWRFLVCARVDVVKLVVCLVVNNTMYRNTESWFANTFLYL